VYTIIGGDGREYGPVPADQVRTWISSGRADMNTRARELGSDEWRPLGDIPEFAGGPRRTPAPPVMAPEPGDARALADTLIAGARDFDVFRCYERSWALVKSQFWPLLGVTLLVGLISVICRVPPYLGMVVSLTLSGVFTGGLQYYYLKRIRGQPTDIGDAFAGFTLAFGPLVIAFIVYLALVMTGFVLLILPGIYLAVAYQFAFLLILDRKLDFWSALEVSRRVITARWWPMFGLGLLGVLFAIIGLLCLVVGVFVAIVLIQGAGVYAYEDLCNPQGRSASAAPRPSPADPPAPAG
jgi:hypothetical protein